ncbi:MAG: sigma-70 family RNA polymerase sigma factor [Gemmataceae bacterium]|nr:sigma-70 family RNA polymerase sigma factor [Gemmataceae bacterium]
MTDTDTLLAGRARDGNRAAFEELVRRTARLVYARLYLDTGDPHRAEDLVQETYLKALAGIRRLKDPDIFRPWLLSIARNVAADAARRDTRVKRSAPVGSFALVSDVPSAGPSPDEAADGDEQRRLVLAALRALPEEYRAPLTLRYIAGADPAAIAAQLGLSNGSVRGYLHRGLKLLRDRLPPEFGE